MYPKYVSLNCENNKSWVQIYGANCTFWRGMLFLTGLRIYSQNFSKTLQCMLSLKKPPSKAEAVLLLSCHQLAESGSKHIVYLKHDLTDKNQTKKALFRLTGEEGPVRHAQNTTISINDTLPVKYSPLVTTCTFAT